MNVTKSRLGSNVKWLVPGMNVKRWLVMIILGLLILILAVILFFLEWGILVRMKGFVQSLFALLPFSPLADPWREIIAILLLVLAAFLIIFGGRKLLYSVVSVTLPENPASLAEIVYAKRLGSRMMKVVAIGGGTGLSTLLRGVKQLPVDLTAIVTVSDDGGSSGLLRYELGILPPGDIRSCLVAMSEAEPLMEDLFQYRFDPAGSMAGHNFGNLFIAALTKVTGDFGKAVLGASQVLRVNGQVLPFTLDNVVLEAQFLDGTHMEGETRIREAGKKITEVRLKPSETTPTPGILERIQAADAILIGPGSLYTSLIPPLLEASLARAVRESKAVRIFVCNAMTEHGETDGYTVADHLKALFQHAGGRVIDYCLINHSHFLPATLENYRRELAAPVTADLDEVRALGVLPVQEELIAADGVVRHDPPNLAQAIWRLLLQARRRRKAGS